MTTDAAELHGIAEGEGPGEYSSEALAATTIHGTKSQHLTAINREEREIPEDIWRQCHVRARGHRGAKRTYLELGRQYPDVTVPMYLVQRMVDAVHSNCFG